MSIDETANEPKDVSLGSIDTDGCSDQMPYRLQSRKNNELGDTLEVLA